MVASTDAFVSRLMSAPTFVRLAVYAVACSEINVSAAAADRSYDRLSTVLSSRARDVSVAENVVFSLSLLSRRATRTAVFWTTIALSASMLLSMQPSTSPPLQRPLLQLQIQLVRECQQSVLSGLSSFLYPFLACKSW